MSLVIFIIILSILVIVHEWGHYKSAKLLGVKVEKFSVGFGKKLFSWHRDGTEFMISAVPLGGYVKMAGDERDKCRGTADEFYSHPIGHRAIIILMGPIVNYVFAFVCFFVIFLTGFPVLTARVGNVIEDYPAQSAGIEAGDMITRIDGQPVNSWDELQEFVTTSPKKVLAVELQRGDDVILKQISPKEKTVKSIFGIEETVKLIGVQPENEIKLVRYGFGESIFRAGDQLIQITVMTFKALYHVVVGAMPAKDALAGPIRIFDVIRDAMTEGISYLLYITAAISASLAIFNLFPVPVLDGGHLFLLLLEKIRRKPLSLKVEENLTRVGFGLLMCLMVFVLYNDVIAVGWVDSVQNFFQGINTE